MNRKEPTSFSLLSESEVDSFFSRAKEESSSVSNVEAISETSERHADASADKGPDAIEIAQKKVKQDTSLRRAEAAGNATKKAAAFIESCRESVSRKFKKFDEWMPALCHSVIDQLLSGMEAKDVLELSLLKSIPSMEEDPRPCTLVLDSKGIQHGRFLKNAINKTNHHAPLDSVKVNRSLSENGAVLLNETGGLDVSINLQVANMVTRIRHNLQESFVSDQHESRSVALAKIQTTLSRSIRELKEMPLRSQIGWIKSIQGRLVYCALLDVRIGDICDIKLGNGDRIAEVIGIKDGEVILAPFGDVEGLSSGLIVVPRGHKVTVPVGKGLLSRVIGPLGNVVDNKGPLKDVQHVGVESASVAPMDRPLISERMETGVRAIDLASLLGRGQRLAVFGSAGTGKTSLLSSIARNADADVIVVALVGERGREIREFLDRHLPEHTRSRIVCIVSTSEAPAIERLYAVHSANRIAEHFRDEGKSVLLLVDSMTRVARALRELGLEAGEPPMRRGFPASVYSALPKIIERAGTSKLGSITALYTVLKEGEDSEDPIVEEVASLTDGHISLSRDLAQRGQYPAIDVLQSMSRLMSEIASESHQKDAQTMRRLMARYRDAELLIQIGEYVAGSDQELDRAVDVYSNLNELLAQEPEERASFEKSLRRLSKVVRR